MCRTVILSMLALLFLASDFAKGEVAQPMGQLSATSAHGQIIELVAIVRMDKTVRTAWKPDGSKIEISEKWSKITEAARDNPTHGFVFRCQGFQQGQNLGWGVLVPGMVTPILKDDVPEFVSTSKVIKDGSTAKFRIGILGAWGPWQRIDVDGKPEDSKPVPQELKPLYQFVEAAEIIGGGETAKTTLITGFGLKGVVGNKQFQDRGEWEVVAVDGDGKRHDRRGVGIWNGGQIPYFGLAKDDISHFEYRLRPYLEWMTFDNVPLEPGGQPNAKVTTEAVDLSKAK